MRLALDTPLEFEPEPIAVTHFKTQGLLYSNYK